MKAVVSSQPSLGVKWLLILAFAITTLVASYLYLHNLHPGQPYFWLKGTQVFSEIIYWSLLGALFTLFVSTAGILTNNEYSLTGRKIRTDCIQLLIAPLFALLLFTAIFYFKENEALDNSFLVLSLVAGLLSGHIILLFKTVFANRQFKGFILEDDHGITVEEVTETPYGLNLYGKVIIIPELDDAGLFYAEKENVLKKGLDNVSITLQKGFEGDIIMAARNMDNHGRVIFVADELEYEDYIIRAMQYIRLDDGSMLSLFGEMPIHLREAQRTICLPLHKLVN